MILEPDNKRYDLHFDGRGYAVEIENLKNQIHRLHRKEEIIKEVNKQEQTEVRSLSELEDYLRASTGLKNVRMAAEAQEVESLWKELTEIEAKGYPDPKTIEKKEGRWIPKQKFLNDLKRQYTSELPEELRPYYDKLDKAVEIVNSLPGPMRHAIIAPAHGMHDWKVNIHRVFESRSYIE